MLRNKQNIFYLSLIILIIVIFLLNHNHTIQSATYNDVFKPIAENLISGNGYTCAFFENQPAFYPLWGYTFIASIDVLLNAGNYFVLAIQAILCLIGIFYFYKLFKVKPKFYHLFFFIPYIAVFSVLWPDCIVLFLFIIFIYGLVKYFEKGSTKYLIISGISFGVLSNFRSEYLYFLPFMILLYFTRTDKKKISKTFLAVLFALIVFLLPWGVRSYLIDDNFRFSATNGGSVAYISLGQLPDNPWNIAPSDQSAFDFAYSKGEINPYTPNSDKLLKAQFYVSVKEHPLPFVKKCFFNSINSVIGGVYTGEYANFFIGLEKRLNIDSTITKTPGILNKINFVKTLDTSISFFLFSEKAIRSIFIVVYLILQVLFLWFLIYNKNKDYHFILLIIALFYLNKVLSVGLLQYEYRHLNIVYIFLFGTYLLSIPILKEKLQFFRKK